MFGKVQIILFIVGALFALGSDWLQMPQLMPWGMSSIGGSVLFMGLEAIVTRKTKWYQNRYYYERYGGIAAISLGVLLVLAGLALITYATAIVFHQEDTFIGLILGRYGIFIFFLSLFYFLRGLASAIGYENPTSTLNDRVVKGFDRFLGFVAVSLGLGGMGIGTFQFFFPEVFRAIMQSLFQTFLHLFL